MKNEIEKVCENCIFYVPHYIKNGARYHLTNGQCINKKTGGYYRKAEKVCEYYEERDLKKEREDDLKSAAEWLAFIGERLNDLTQILKNDAYIHEGDSSLRSE